MDSGYRGEGNAHHLYPTSGMIMIPSEGAAPAISAYVGGMPPVEEIVLCCRPLI